MASQLSRVLWEEYGESQRLGALGSPGGRRAHDFRPRGLNRRHRELEEARLAAASHVIGGEAPARPALTNAASGRTGRVRDSQLG